METNGFPTWGLQQVVMVCAGWQAVLQCNLLILLPPFPLCVVQYHTPWKKRTPTKYRRIHVKPMVSNSPCDMGVTRGSGRTLGHHAAWHMRCATSWHDCNPFCWLSIMRGLHNLWSDRLIGFVFSTPCQKGEGAGNSTSISGRTI
jgi:hypothetical protein